MLHCICATVGPWKFKPESLGATPGKVAMAWPHNHNSCPTWMPQFIHMAAPNQINHMAIAREDGWHFHSSKSPFMLWFLQWSQNKNVLIWGKPAICKQYTNTHISTQSWGPKHSVTLFFQWHSGRWQACWRGFPCHFTNTFIWWQIGCERGFWLLNSLISVFLPRFILNAEQRGEVNL